jgi:uncharacterized protein YkwD
MLSMPTLALIFSLFFSGFKSAPVRTVSTPRPRPTAVALSKYQPTAIPTATPTMTPTPTASTTPTPQPTPVRTTVPFVVTPTPTPTAKPSLTHIQQINVYRASYGLSPVSEDPQTCAYATLRAAELVRNFSHNGTPYPYDAYSLVTENIAMTTNPAEVVSLWINSPGHAENMRKDTPYVCVRNNGPYYAYEGWKP